MTWRHVCACVVILLLVASCGHTVPSFNAERAFDDLVLQTAYGPRVPGSDAHTRCGNWLRSRLSQVADSVWIQKFTGVLAVGADPSDSIPMQNIIARFALGRSPRILLAAHWDSRPAADMDADSSKHDQPVPGANDGASGVAVLLEVARALSKQVPPVGVDIVFFDGEDAGRYDDERHWVLGSKYFAAHLPVRYQWAILLDMVGDRDLNLYREGYSYRFARKLQDRIWEKARDINDTVFKPELENDILDDHLPLLMRGIPAVDIIDIRYPYWHTTEDTPDKCSAASLGEVGRLVLELVYGE